MIEWIYLLSSVWYNNCLHFTVEFLLSSGGGELLHENITYQ